MSLSWFLNGFRCRHCKYPVVVTQGKECDYRYYCSNPDCAWHKDPPDLGDMEDAPVFCESASN